MSNSDSDTGKFKKLGSEDPTPDAGTPAAEVLDLKKETVFREVLGASIDASEVAEEIVKAAEVAAEKAEIPLSHHVVTELRKFLIPVVTALIGMAAGGGLGFLHGESGKENAVEAVREESSELEEMKSEIRKLISDRIHERVNSGGWSDIGEVLNSVDPQAVAIELRTKHGEKATPELVASQIQQIQAFAPKEE